MGLVRNVNKDTFKKLAQDFMALNDGQAFAVCPVDWTQDKETVLATAREWKAWRAYRRDKGLPVAFMDMRAQDGKPWSVPTKWPHEFDAERNVQEDFRNAGQA